MLYRRRARVAEAFQYNQQHVHDTPLPIKHDVGDSRRYVVDECGAKKYLRYGDWVLKFNDGTSTVVLQEEFEREWCMMDVASTAHKLKHFNQRDDADTFSSDEA